MQQPPKPEAPAPEATPPTDTPSKETLELLPKFDELQALCFLAGAGSIFVGTKLLTTPNPGRDRDAELFARLGLRGNRRSSYDLADAAQ